MNAGNELLDRALASGARSIVVVGTGKNVGKTVAMRAIYEAACERGIVCGLTSIGRDGEAVDVGDAQAKPRLMLRPPTVVATARDVLPSSPASEMLEVGGPATAAGTLAIVRVAVPAFYELVGAPTASGLRESVDRLAALCDLTIVDGAIDRVAAVAGGADAIVVATGASAAATMDEAVGAAAALVRRLAIPAYDPKAAFVRIEGALTASAVAEFIARKETRQIVLRDPTQLALSGRAATTALERLTIRCERPLRVIAATASSIGRDRYFEPKAFLHAVARATGLPAFDVYQGAMAA